MARIIEFQGRRISVPDNATDDEIRTILQSAPSQGGGDTNATGGAPTLSAAPAEVPAAAPAEPSLVDNIMSGAGYGLDTLGQAAAGARTGVTNFLGLPVDLINAAPMALNLLPGVEGIGPLSPAPFGGSGMLNNIATLGGNVDAGEPTDAFQRGVRRVGEEIGAAAVPGAGIIAATRGMTLAAARELPFLARIFAEPAVASPAKFLGKEATVATGAGIGATGLNELTGNQDRSNPWIDAGGAIGGALTTGLGGMIGSLGKNIYGAMTGSPKFADDVVRDAVMNDIATNAGIVAKPGQAPDLTPLIQATEEGKRVSETIPGFSDSLADRTRNPGLAALEYGRQSGPNAGMYTQARANNTAAIDNAFGPMTPTETPGAFSSALRDQRDMRLDAARGTTEVARQDFESVAERLAPQLTAEGRGAGIRAALEDASDDAKAIVEQAWRPVNEARDTVDVAALKAAFGDVQDSVPEALKPLLPSATNVPDSLVSPGTPAQASGILDASGNPIMRAATPEVGEQALSEVMGIRTALTNDLRRQGITPQEQRLVSEHIAKLDEFLDANVPAPLRQQYDEARAATRDFNDRFTRPQDAIAQTLAEREGKPRGSDADVARKFVQADERKIADFTSLMREAGNDDRVRIGVRDQILADVEARSLLNSEKGLSRYLDQYSTVFKQFPDLKDEIGTAGALRTRYAQAEAAEKALTQELNTAGRSSVASYLSYGDEKASQAMRNVLASRDPAKAIDDLISFVGDDPKAVEGARRVIWDIMQDSSRAGGRTTSTISGAQPWSPQALNTFLTDPTNNAVLDRLYRDSPEHLNDIRAVSEALQGVDLRNSAKAANTSGTAQGVGTNILTPETIQSRLYAYGSGRISGTFLVTSMVSVLARRSVRKAQEAGVQRMLDEVLNNADTAALMMRENNPAARQALARRAKLWFGNDAGSILNSMSEEDEGDDPVVGAAFANDADEGPTMLPMLTVPGGRN